MMENDARKTTNHANIKEIPVFELGKDNFESFLPYLLVCIKESDLVALDLEMSGLGPIYGLKARDTEVKYDGFRSSADSRAILSLGIATFKLKSRSERKKEVKYDCQVFNILTCPNRPFMMEPDAMKFLVEHGFDFNKLTNNGILYYPMRKDKSCPLRRLFTGLMSESKPIALHNGFLDLCFIYHQLFTDLPDKLEDFLAALSELFPPEAPLIDSKYLAEYVTRMKGSYLEYVFRKCQRDNVSEATIGRAYIRVNFDAYRESLKADFKASIEKTNCELPSNFPKHLIPSDIKESLCEHYANHGFCRRKDCLKLHDVDFALDLESLNAQKGRQRRKRRYEHITESLKEQNGPSDKQNDSDCGSSCSIASTDMVTSKITVAEITKSKPRIAVHGSHRAGVDAFMTGFSALFQNRMHLLRTKKCNPEWSSLLALSGKPFPLTIRKSHGSMIFDSHLLAFMEIDLERSRKKKILEENKALA